MFSPGVIAVLDVPTHPRPSWIVSKEGKGLDFALEVMVLGHRRKDIERNVQLYASLGIREYFIFDRPKLRLQGYRLRLQGDAYEAVLPQHGYFRSDVLGLNLAGRGERLRFCMGDAELPGADELVSRLESSGDDLVDRLAMAEARAEEEAKRAAGEARRADEAEAALKRALDELERLKRERL